MPGIAGIVGSTCNEQQLRSMIESMLHEDYYSSGTYVNEDIGVCAGWVALEDSFVDCMPIWNETRDKCLFFAGEEYPDEQVLEALRKKGHEFDTDDASYLIHLFEEERDEFFLRLNGFFHGLLIDLAAQEAILFNDRYGMQRVYCYEREGAFFFASEAKALLRVCPELRALDLAGLGQMLSMGCVLGQGTLYRNMVQLPAASVWTFVKGGCEKRKYFSPEVWETQELLGTETFYRELKETFRRIQPKYLRGSGRIGISLTGGLDTRLIMAHADLPPGMFPCYTFASMYRESFDLKVARKVARICGQEHSALTVGKEFLSSFRELAEQAVYIGDGYLDVGSGAAELYLNRLAREISPIRLTGCYGSEVLRAVRGFRYRGPADGMFVDELRSAMERAAAIYAEGTAGHRLSSVVFKEAPFFNYSRVALEQSQVTKRSPFMDNDLVALAYRAPQEAVDNDRLSLRLVRDGNPRLGSIITNRGAGGGSDGLVSRFRQSWYEFLFLAEVACDYGMRQWMTRIDRCLAPLHLERLFLGRNGFCHFRGWFRDELSEFVQEVLLDRQTLSRPYFEKGVLERLVRGHVKQGYNYTGAIDTALRLELIHRRLLESQ